MWVTFWTLLLGTIWTMPPVEVTMYGSPCWSRPWSSLPSFRRMLLPLNPWAMSAEGMMMLVAMASRDWVWPHPLSGGP